MELFQLKYFLAVAKYEHVTKAAESLHIAQPAVSQAIRHLEEEFDTPLFDRENRHITLNATGKMLQKRLTPIMAALDAIPDEIKEAAQQNQPVIHLNLRSASSVITNCIIAYREIHPEVKFRLSQKPDDPIADYFISATGLDTELKPSQRVLFTEEFYLAVPTSSELSHKHSIRLQDTATESYVSLEKTRPVRQICDEFCAAAEFKPNIVYESDSPETVRNLIAAGLGIGFWPQYSWESSFSKHVKLLPIKVRSADARSSLLFRNPNNIIARSWNFMIFCVAGSRKTFYFLKSPRSCFRCLIDIGSNPHIIFTAIAKS